MTVIPEACSEGPAASTKYHSERKQHIMTKP